MSSRGRTLLAHVLPVLLFMGFLAVGQWITRLGESFPLRHAEFWIYPTQTIVCGVSLIWFWRYYNIGKMRDLGFTLLIAFAVFLVWISPQQFFGLAPRTNGFDPTLLLNNKELYWLTVGLRFLRLVIVVPAVEEVFWRNFLLRFLIDEDFSRVPFGKFSWLSFGVVTLAFALGHSRPDWAAAVMAGAAYNAVAFRTRCLSSCILGHAFTNGLLGLWIMYTGQWGFW